MATIRKRGDKWQVQVRRKGSVPQSRSFESRKDAQAWARQMEAKIDRGVAIPDLRVLDRMTLGDLVARYLKEVSPSKRCYEVEATILRAFLKHPICLRKLAQISRSDFASYRDERLTRIKPVSLKRELSPIQNMFEIAASDWELPIALNPLIGLKISVLPAKRERRLRPGEWQRLEGALGACRNELVPEIVRFALLTGMRRSEILELEWDRVDFTSSSIVLRLTKNGHQRVLPLTDAMASLLRRIPRQGERVFPVSTNALRLSWERVRKRAGLKDFHFHDLRHEAISRFFEIGLSLPEVSLLSGHRDVRMLLRYGHGDRANIIRKLNIISS